MILGHASAAVTLGVYAHFWPGDDDRARDHPRRRSCGLCADRGGGRRQTRRSEPQDALLTEDMLKSATRQAGIAVRVK